MEKNPASSNSHQTLIVDDNRVKKSFIINLRTNTRKSVSSEKHIFEARERSSKSQKKDEKISKKFMRGHDLKMSGNSYRTSHQVQKLCENFHKQKQKLEVQLRKMKTQHTQKIGQLCQQAIKINNQYAKLKKYKLDRCANQRNLVHSKKDTQIRNLREIKEDKKKLTGKLLMEKSITPWNSLDIQT